MRGSLLKSSEDYRSSERHYTKIESIVAEISSEIHYYFYSVWLNIYQGLFMVMVQDLQITTI